MLDIAPLVGPAENFDFDSPYNNPLIHELPVDTLDRIQCGLEYLRALTALPDFADWMTDRVTVALYDHIGLLERAAAFERDRLGAVAKVLAAEKFAETGGE